MSDEEKAKSLMLSASYEINGVYRGRTPDELNVIAADIRMGKPFEFDASEIQDVIAYAHQVLAIPPRQLIVDGLKWIGVPIVILIVIYLLLFMK
jgi:hypothetical protein